MANENVSNKLDSFGEETTGNSIDVSGFTGGNGQPTGFSNLKTEVELGGVDLSASSILDDGLGLFMPNSFKDENETFEEIKEKVGEITEGFLKKSSTLKETLDFTVLSISKSNTSYGTLAYSTIVVVAKYKEGAAPAGSDITGISVPFLIARTGEDTITIEDFVRLSSENLTKSVNDRPIYPTFVNAIDEDFYEIIDGHVKASGCSKSDYLPTIIVTNSLSDEKTDVKVAQLAQTIAKLAIGNIAAAGFVNNIKLTGISDLNIGEFTAKHIHNKGTEYKMVHGFQTLHGKLIQDVDSLGFETRKDFKLSLEVQSSNTKQNRSLNRANNNFTLTETCGFLEAIPAEVQEADKTNPNNVVIKFKFIPQIVITKAVGSKPTIGFKLLSIAVAGAVLNNKNYLHILYNNLSSPTNTPIGLNSIIPTDNPFRINLEDKSLSQDTIKACLQDLFSEDPVVAYDAIEYGESGFVDGIFLRAVENNDSEAKSLIVKAAVELTNGAFPSNFDINRIFVPELKTLVPIGHYYNKETKEYRDIRDVDFMYICNSNKATEEDKFQWYQASINNDARTINVNGVKGFIDSYEMKLHLINKLAFTGASVIGNATRITFSNEFVITLAQALEQTGFKFSTSLANIGGLNPITGFNQTRNYFQNAQISRATSNFSNFGYTRTNNTFGAAGNNSRFMFHR